MLDTELRKNALVKQLESYPPTLDPSQVAEILGITRRTVDKLLDNGNIEFFTINPDSARKLKRVTKVDLIDYMVQNHINKTT